MGGGWRDVGRVTLRWQTILCTYRRVSLDKTGLAYSPAVPTSAIMGPVSQWTRTGPTLYLQTLFEHNKLVLSQVEDFVTVYFISATNWQQPDQQQEPYL